MTVAENKAALDKHENEIADLRTKIQQLTTTIAEHKADIQSLKTQPAVQVSKQVFPLKPPIAYKRSNQGSFFAYAQRLLTYFKAVNVEPEDRASLLLTFLSAEEFEMVTRIHDVESFSREEETTFDKAVEMINDVLQHEIISLEQCHDYRRSNRMIEALHNSLPRLRG